VTKGVKKHPKFHPYRVKRDNGFMVLKAKQRIANGHNLHLFLEMASRRSVYIEVKPQSKKPMQKGVQRELSDNP
jgi:hypothetical protein